MDFDSALLVSLTLFFVVAGLHTGRYPIRTGAFPGVFNPSSQNGLPGSEVMLPSLLKEEGYATFMVGK